MGDAVYYVRTDGSNDNDGTVDSAAGAFRTWARGIAAVYTTVIRRGTVTLSAGNQGTPQAFFENVRIGPMAHSGRLILRGASDHQTTISSYTGDTILVSLTGNTQVQLERLRLLSQGGNSLKIEYQSLVSIGSDVDFGDAAASQIWVHDSQSILQVLAAKYIISGGCAQHILVQYGHVFFEANHLELANRPEFRNAFVVAYPRGTIQATDNIIAGPSHGCRFDIRHQSLLNLCGNPEQTQLAGNMDGTRDMSSYII